MIIIDTSNSRRADSRREVSAYATTLTQDDSVGFINELFARFRVLAKLHGSRDDFQIVTTTQSIEYLNTRRSHFSVNKHLGFGPQGRGSQNRR